MADRPDTAARRDDTRDPHASRMAALRVLYAADVRGIAPLDVLREELESGPSDDAEHGAAPMDRFAMTLLHGLAASIPEHDARIARFARGWRLEVRSLEGRRAGPVAVRAPQGPDSAGPDGRAGERDVADA